MQYDILAVLRPCRRRGWKPWKKKNLRHRCYTSNVRPCKKRSTVFFKKKFKKTRFKRLLSAIILTDRPKPSSSPSPILLLPIAPSNLFGFARIGRRFYGGGFFFFLNFFLKDIVVVTCWMRILFERDLILTNSKFGRARVCFEIKKARRAFSK